MTNESLFSIVARLKTIMTIDAADKMREQIGSIVDELNSALSASGAYGNMAKAMKAVLKRMKNDAREVLAYSNINKHGQQEVVDGYMLIRSKTVYDAIPVLPADKGKYIDTDRIVTDAVKKSPYKLIMPTMAEVKQYIADYKARFKSENNCDPTAKEVNALIYRIPSTEKRDDNPYVAVYLLQNMLEAFPTAEYTYTNAVKPIYVSSDDGEGILLPVRVDTADTSLIKQYADEAYAKQTESLYAAEQDESETESAVIIRDAIKRVQAQEPISIEEFEALLESHYFEAVGA